MAKVNIFNVVVLDNPSCFKNPFQFEITFECLEDLKEDLEWKIIYVGSAESEEYDQILDSVLVGPLVGGKHKFVFQADPPDHTKIPTQDAVGVTVVLLTCSYKGQEFIRVGYYVNNEYSDPEMKENPPTVPDFDQLTRNILSSSPRVTRFRIDWADGNSDAMNEEDSENQAPLFSTDSESNQMGMDINSDSNISGKMGDSLMGPPTKYDSQAASDKIVFGASSTDSNSMPLCVNGAATNGKSNDEDMQL